MFEFLANQYIVLALLALVGFLGVKAQRTGALTQIYLLRRRDRRGEKLKVKRETDLGMECNRGKLGPAHYIKTGPGWTFSEAGRQITKFFGLEATVYTALIKDEILEHIPLKNYLLLLWDKTFYDSIPPRYRELVEKDTIGVTVEVVPVDPDTYGLKDLKSSDVDNETDGKILGHLGGEEDKPSLTENFYRIGLWIVFGALLMYFLQARGIV